MSWLVYQTGPVGLNRVEPGNGLAHCHVNTLFSLVILLWFGGLATLASWPGYRANLSHVIRALNRYVVPKMVIKINCEIFVVIL